MTSKSKLKIIPLGGIDEIGKNITAMECDGDLIVIDCGSTFPKEDMLGIDLVNPDISYLDANRDRLRGYVFTHG
ncbi:MAG: ribonuclease J, partial [Eubacteriales bacterium]